MDVDFRGIYRVLDVKFVCWNKTIFGRENGNVVNSIIDSPRDFYPVSKQEEYTDI